jgi:methyl-accepting chemotaxis protein
MFGRMKIAARVYLINGISALGMIALVFVGTNAIGALVLKERTDQTHEIVESAQSIVESYLRRSASGELTPEAAQKEALGALAAIRYGGENYVWVNNLDGVMLEHPTVSLVGQDVLGIKDVKGNAIFSQINDLVREKGSGEYHYFWQVDGKPKEKLSYFKGVPEWNWVIATGVYLDDVAKEIAQVRNRLGLMALILLAIAQVIAISIGRSISVPLNSLAKNVAQLATGDLSIEVKGKERSDEVGIIARSIEDLKLHLLEKSRRQLAEQEEAMQGAEAQRKRVVVDMTDKFDETITVFLGALSNSVGEMQTTSEGLKKLADLGHEKAFALKGTTSAVTENVSNVAGASEEMLASIKEITMQISRSSERSRDAVDQTQKAGNSIGELKVLSEKINEVSKLIQNIAAQTNLLALNATIEAARAGEAGKGFAVVASEVKTLATQTGKATEEIDAQISAIHIATENAVHAITNVSGIVEEVNETSASVAAAMEEQSSAISDIVRNTQLAADRTREAGQIASAVSESSEQTQTSAKDIDLSSVDLAEKTEDLKGAVEIFLAHLKTTQ